MINIITISKLNLIDCSKSYRYIIRIVAFMVHLKFIMFFKRSPIRNPQNRDRSANGPLQNFVCSKKNCQNSNFFRISGGGGGVLEADGNPTVKKPRHFSLSANMCQPGLFQRRKIDNPLQALVFATIH